MLQGSIVAMVTPFSGSGLDERGIAELASWQVREGSAAIAVNTVLGEISTLSSEERSRVVSVVRESVGGRLPVIAGICTSCTAAGVEEARRAENAGAHALLVVVPPYSRPTQDGIVRHFEEIAGATDLPVLIHDDPGRTRVHLSPEAAVLLLARDTIVGLVDGTGDLARVSTPARSDRRSPKLFSTRDGLMVPFLMAGGTGVLSALANVAPWACAELHAAVRCGSAGRAKAILASLQPLIDALGPEPDPATIKYALFLVRDRFDPTPRLPLVPAPCTTARVVAGAIESLCEHRVCR